MRVLLEAVFGLGAPEAKLADTLTAHRAQVAAHAKDAPSQLALLIALEHYMSGGTRRIVWVGVGVLSCACGCVGVAWIIFLKVGLCVFAEVCVIWINNLTVVVCMCWYMWV